MVICLTFVTGGQLIKAAADDDKKEEYYQEYKEICETVNKTAAQNIFLLPMNEIEDEDLIEPNIFKETVSDISKADYQDIVGASNILKASSALSGKFSKTKSCTTKVTSMASVTIKCKLTGTYYYDKSMKRCYFGKINNPTSTVSGGSWKSRGYAKSLIDGSRTVSVVLKGKVVVGSNYSKNFNRNIEFHCTEEGNIK